MLEHNSVRRIMERIDHAWASERDKTGSLRQLVSRIATNGLEEVTVSMGFQLIPVGKNPSKGGGKGPKPCAAK